MIKIILFLFFATHFILFHLQEKPIEVIVTKSSKDLVFKGINRSQIQQKVTLEIDTTNLIGYSGPITKFIAAQDTIVMVRLSFAKGKKWSYSTNYSFVPKPTSAELRTQNELLRKQTLKVLKTLIRG
ncbi:MAG: hypothetical protein WBG90_07790 [Saonia sp.]